jgi:CBS domain-containing protein
MANQVLQPVLARDIMTTRLVKLSPQMDVFDAIGLLLKHQISGAPVVDAEGRLVGTLSEKHCMSVLVEGACHQLPTTEVWAYMETDPRTISEDTDLLTIAQIFLTAPTRRLPVMREGELVGQVSRRDVLRAAHRMMEVQPNREIALLYLSSLIEREAAPIRQ